MRDGKVNCIGVGERLDGRFLTQSELAERWRISARTLEKWRQRRIGPAFIRIGGRVRYPVLNIETFEAAQLRGQS